MAIKLLLHSISKFAIFAPWVLCFSVCLAQQEMSVLKDDLFLEPFANVEAEDSEFCDPAQAEFGHWESLFEEPSDEACCGPALKPFDWVRHFGFRHSSTHGRHVGCGLPLEGTSWMNRPYHVDWFLGAFLGDELIRGQVTQENELISGFRIARDIDYYWGLEWRFGWSDPSINVTGATSLASGSVFLSDVDLVYYPWGDSKVRPYGLLGTGFARFDFVDDSSVGRNTTLVTMPIGCGVQFFQFPWLVWRLEALDNMAFGADGLNTQHNATLTAGMEFRFGARPESYWPWRSSRRIW
jgi:hypothetical protein